ncbi:hypothetical protein HK102_011970, partial [Quaeritorhiza haematococci]
MTEPLVDPLHVSLLLLYGTNLEGKPGIFASAWQTSELCRLQRLRATRRPQDSSLAKPKPRRGFRPRKARGSRRIAGTSGLSGRRAAKRCVGRSEIDPPSGSDAGMRPTGRVRGRRRHARLAAGRRRRWGGRGVRRASPCLLGTQEPPSDDDPQRPEPPGGLVEGLLALAEAEADVGAAEVLVLEEAGAGDGRHADLADELAGEGDVVGRAEGGDAGHDVVGALGGLELEADFPEGLAEAVAARLVGGGEVVVVGPGEAVGDRARLLERGRGADRDEVVDLAEGLRE